MAPKYPGAGKRGLLPITEVRALARAKDTDPLRFEVAVSSEYEVTRQSWLGGIWRERLVHKAGAIDMERFKSGRAPVLVDHGGDQVGVIESAQLDSDKVLRAVIRFSANPRGQEIQRDVVDGIRSNISVGYIPERVKLVEEDSEKGDLWDVTRWQPLELSIVSVPADPTVGVGRSAAGASRPVVVTEVQQMSDTAVVNREALDELAEAFGYGVKDVRKWMADGLTVEAVQRKILQERATNATATASAESVADAMASAGLSHRDAARYSISRAILAAADGKEPDGLEGEVHRFLAKHSPVERVRRNGILVPMSVTPTSKRTLSSVAAGKGAETVFEQKGDLIELLRNRARVVEAGARLLTGLTSPINFPKQTAPGTAVWVGENAAAISEADLALALALFAPKTLMSATSYSRQLLVQNSIAVDNMVTDDLAAIHALALDLAGLHGLGAAGEPTGIYKAIGVSVTDRSGGAGAMRYSDAVAMVAQIANANADVRNATFLFHPTMAANLMQVQRFTNTDSPVWQGNLGEGTVAGLRAFTTTQLSKTMTGSDRTGGSNYGVVVGNFSDMLVGTWGALEIVVDPYTSKKKGLIEVASFQMADILIRHGESFSKGTSFTG